MGATLEFLKRVKNAATIERLHERARQDASPRGYVELCRTLVVQGNSVRALSAAQEGIRRFPRSLEISDQLRLIWGQSAREELLELERAARETLSSEALRALAEHYLSVEELDPALEAAQRLSAHHPEEAGGPLLVGRILWKRFARDHVASDGMRALDALRRSIALDGRTLEAFHLLAEASFYVGAVRKALEAAACGLAIAPADKDLASLHALLLQLAPEEATAAELLRSVEEHDAPWRGYRPPESRDRAFEASAKAQISRMLHQISLIAGVRGLGFAREGLELSARDGHVFEARRSPSDPMMTLTATFRRRISASVKHLGIGAFQESELSLENATVLAFGAMSAVLLVEVEPGARTAVIMAASRDVMGSVDRVPGGPVHA